MNSRNERKEREESWYRIRLCDVNFSLSLVALKPRLRNLHKFVEQSKGVMLHILWRGHLANELINLATSVKKKRKEKISYCKQKRGRQQDGRGSLSLVVGIRGLFKLVGIHDKEDQGQELVHPLSVGEVFVFL